MQYKHISELPQEIRNSLSKDLQQQYLQLFNSAWEEYEDDDTVEGKKRMVATAHQTAWEEVTKQPKEG